jgi:hypothetical protein
MLVNMGDLPKPDKDCLSGHWSSAQSQHLNIAQQKLQLQLPFEGSEAFSAGDGVAGSGSSSAKQQQQQQNGLTIEVDGAGRRYLAQSSNNTSPRAFAAQGIYESAGSSSKIRKEPDTEIDGNRESNDGSSSLSRGKRVKLNDSDSQTTLPRPLEPTSASGPSSDSSKLPADAVLIPTSYIT